MTNRHVWAYAGHLALGVILVAVAGCGGGGGKTGTGGTGATGATGGTGATGAVGGGACPASSTTGTLSIEISGTPSLTGAVVVGPAASGTQVTTSTDLTLPAGPQTLTAFLTAEPGTMVRTAYTPTVDDPTPCVTAGAVTTVHVTYALIQTSGLVWTGLENGASASTLGGYDPVDVSATGNALAAVLANAHGSDGFTFDDLGNLWVTGGTTADPAVARYPAAMFANGGNLSPDFTLSMSLPAWGGGIPGAQVVTFDPQGNLWVSVDAANKVVKFDADQLVAGGSTVPSVEESGINAPQGVAFDTAGNMWVAASGDAKVMRINAVHLTATGSGADFEITAMRAGAVGGALTSPLGIAFDGGGNLWVNYDGTIAELPASILGGTGTFETIPPVQLETDVAALPEGIAFDEQGGLWLAYTSGRFARFAASQLIGQGVATPSTIISSSDIAGGTAGWFAIYPAPAFTPLAHAFN
jgi:hypothetical protein